MLISIVIPAYNAQQTISRSLCSVFNSNLPDNFSLEVIIVDDGSNVRLDLSEITLIDHTKISVIPHDTNRGMCAARNTGIENSRGDFLVILDADDELVGDWPAILQKTLNAWPSKASVCFANCVNGQGRSTCLKPSYQGYLSLQDLLKETYSGEYLPIFKGQYIRNRLYTDLCTRKSCGLISYIKFALDGDFWISSDVLRIYHDNQAGSVTQNWSKPEKCVETVSCHEAILASYGYLYKRYAPSMYHKRYLKLAVYKKLACMKGCWGAWLKGVSFRTLKESIAVAFLMILKPHSISTLILTLKKMGLLKQYG